MRSVLQSDFQVQSGNREQLVHALQASFECLDLSPRGGRFDTNREQEKIGTNMQVLALIATAPLTVRRTIEVHHPQCLISQLGLT